MSGKHSSVCRAGLVSRGRLGTWGQNVLLLSCVWERELIITLALAVCALWERTRSHRNILGLRAGIMKMLTPWPFPPSLASSFSGYQVNPRGHLMGSFWIPVSAVPSGGLSQHGCCLSKIVPCWDVSRVIFRSHCCGPGVCRHCSRGGEWVCFLSAQQRPCRHSQ